ncbi:MAG: YerC/YecD family TrpR-related protein [Allosphingosinicella sp.]
MKQDSPPAAAPPAPEPTRDPARLGEALCAALLTPGSREEMARFLTDLCTPAEIRTLGERWHVARLLDGTGLSYREIHDATGVSTTTIVRVARFLRQEPNRGYRQALDASASKTGGGGDAG